MKYNFVAEFTKNTGKTILEGRERGSDEGRSGDKTTTKIKGHQRTMTKKGRQFWGRKK